MIHSYNDKTFNFQSKPFKYIYISICWKRKSHCFSRLPNLAYSFVLFTFCLSAVICVHVFVVYHFSISYAGEISTVCLFSRFRYSYFSFFDDSNAFSHTHSHSVCITQHYQTETTKKQILFFAWATYSIRKSIELPVLPSNEIVFLQCIKLSSTRSIQTDFGSCNFSAWFLYAKCKHTNEIFFWTAYKILCLIVIAINGFLYFEFVCGNFDWRIKIKLNLINGKIFFSK